MRIGTNILFWTGMRSGSGVVFNGTDSVIIDSLMRRDSARLILELMQLYGIDLTTVRYLINTHGDPDHVGGNAELLRATGAQLVAHTLEAELIERPEGRPLLGSRFRAAREGVREGCKVDIRIEGEDEVFKVGELALRFLLAPGHTPGTMCIYHAPSKALFTGDLVLGSGYACYTVPMVRKDIETVVRSLERLLQLEVEWLLPGHGDVIHGAHAVHEQITMHIRELKQLSPRVLTLLEEAASTVSELSERLLVWPQTIAKVLIDLEADGKIRKLIESTMTTTERWEAT